MVSEARDVKDADRSVKGSVTSGLGWGLLNSVVGRLGQFLVGVALARILAPDDFGVFAVALVVFSVVVNISEMGVSVVLLRSAGDVRRLVPTVTTLTLSSGILLGAGCWLVADSAASWMDVPSAAPVIRVLAVAIVVAGASAVPGAMLQRDFRQDLRMAIDLAALVLSSTLTIGLALAGEGAMSLAWGRLAAAVLSLVLLLSFAPGLTWPGLDMRLIPGLLRAGLPLAGTSLVLFALLNVDYVVIGKALGPVSLGLYVLAYNVSSWPVSVFSSAVRAVAVPAFAAVSTDDERAAAFVRAARMLLTPTLLVCTLLAVLADPLILVVYGERWSGAAAPLVFLSLLGAWRVAMELAYGLQVAAGRGRAVLWVNLGWLIGLSPALWLGARTGGLWGAGLAHAVVLLLLVGPLQLRLLRSLGVSLRSLVTALTRPVLAAAAGGCAARLVHASSATDALAVLLSLLAGGLTCALLARPVLAEAAGAWQARHVEQRR